MNIKSHLFATIAACAALGGFAAIGPTTSHDDIPGDATIADIISAGGGAGGVTLESVTNVAKYTIGQYDTTNLTDRITAKMTRGESIAASQVTNASWISDLSPATNYINSVITNTCPAFSNAVLTVGLGISTNEVASIKAMVSDFSDIPIGSGATTIGVLLIALAGAVTWLKKHTVKTDGETSQSVSGELIIGDLNVVGGTKFEIVSSVPANPASDTLYFITGS